MGESFFQCQNLFSLQEVLTLGLLQVTASCLKLVDATTRRQLTEWKAPPGLSINVATASSSQVISMIRGILCTGARR